MYSYIAIPLMVASIGSGVAKCAAESTVKGVARKAEVVVAEKVAMATEKAGAADLSKSVKELANTAHSSSDVSKVAPEVRQGGKVADDSLARHLPAAVLNKQDTKYRNALDAAQKRFKETGQVGSLGKLTDLQLSALDWKIQPPPISGLAVVPTDQSVWAQTFSPLERSSTRTASATASENDLRNAIKSRGAFDAGNIDTSIEKIPKTAEEFRRNLVSSPSPIYVVIGHNENGKFVVPPSHTILLSEMADACGAVGKVCVFFSCESDKVVKNGVRREITFLEADELLTEVRSLSTAAMTQGYTLRDFAGALPDVVQATETRQERRRTFRFGVKMLPVVGLTGGGLALTIGSEKKKADLGK